MKKVLSLFLAVIFAVGILPVAALAADGDYVEITAATYADTSSVALGGNQNYKIVSGETVVIEEDQTWTVSEGCSLFVYGKLEIKGKLIVNGYVSGVGNEGEVTAKCWYDGGVYKNCTIINGKNICGNELNRKRYFAEIHMPEQPLTGGFSESGGAPKLKVTYYCSTTGSANDYLREGVSFIDVYTSTDYNAATSMLKVPLNQYLFLHFDFLINGEVAKKYDGNRMAIKFNNVPCESAQGVCAHYVDVSGAVEYFPKALVNTTDASFNVWKDSYFARQERIYIPSGTGYSVYGINGEASAVDQTVRLNYGDEFKFRVNIDSDYSDSVYQVYLVEGYQWDERNHQGTMEELLDEVYIDDQGISHHFVWRFDPLENGANQNVYVDSYGVYHISSVENEYTIVVKDVVSNEALSVSANVMDTIRNLINAIKQFFERVKLMLGL